MITITYNINWFEICPLFILLSKLGGSLPDHCSGAAVLPYTEHLVLWYHMATTYHPPRSNQVHFMS